MDVLHSYYFELTGDVSLVFVELILGAAASGRWSQRHTHVAGPTWNNVNHCCVTERLILLYVPFLKQCAGNHQ